MPWGRKTLFMALSAGLAPYSFVPFYNSGSGRSATRINDRMFESGNKVRKDTAKIDRRVIRDAEYAKQKYARLQQEIQLRGDITDKNKIKARALAQVIADAQVKAVGEDRRNKRARMLVMPAIDTGLALAASGLWVGLGPLAVLGLRQWQSAMKTRKYPGNARNLGPDSNYEKNKKRRGI
jgi:hypothetical protein